MKSFISFVSDQNVKNNLKIKDFNHVKKNVNKNMIQTLFEKKTFLAVIF